MNQTYPMPLIKRVILVFLPGGLVVLGYVVLHLLVPAERVAALACLVR